MEDVLDPRRAPRLPIRCAVEIRHRSASWHAFTEDLGPVGCQIVSSRAVAPGGEMKLAIRCDRVLGSLALSGRVVWARAEPPARMGVAFDGAATGAAWFGALLAADPAAARAVRYAVDRIPAVTLVYLGKPPERVLDFSPDELAILSRVGPGIAVGALARALGPDFDRLRGALFSLLRRRLLVLDRAQSFGVARWREAFADAAPATSGRREAEAQRLYEEGIEHLVAGRMDLAGVRFRSALALAPGDGALASLVEQLRV